MEGRTLTNGGLEENTLAILDSSGFKRGSQHTADDRIAFLEAVRAAFIVPEAAIPPTRKMYAAIFQILKEESSVELIMGSYQLLNELDKRFPPVSISRAEGSNLNPPAPCDVQVELAVAEEAWSPFIFSLDSKRSHASKNPGGSLDFSGFHLLIEAISKVADETNSGSLEIKALRDMILLQYLISVLEGDFIPRNSIYQKIMNWSLLRDSLLNMIVGSRRISYKGLVQDCLSIMCDMFRVRSRPDLDGRSLQDSEAQMPKNCDIAAAIALPEIKKNTCTSLRKLLLMIMELDLSKKKADMLGLTTRADAVRTPVVEIIQDELSYNKAAVSPFFEVFTEPKWKLDIIIQYFQKYIAKPSVRTRRSSDSVDEATLDGILKCFSNGNSARNIMKKISPEVIQLLLAHAFQAYLSLPAEHSFEGDHDSKDVRENSVPEICKNVISAFTSLRRTDEHMEILPFAKEALFTAATILSTKS